MCQQQAATLPEGGSERERAPVPSRAFGSPCGAEPILLTGSYGAVDPRRRPWTPTHLGKETNRRCIGRPPTPFAHLQGRSVLCSSSRTDSRFLGSVSRTNKPRQRPFLLICLPLIQAWCGAQIAIGLPLLASVRPYASVQQQKSFEQPGCHHTEEAAWFLFLIP